MTDEQVKLVARYVPVFAAGATTLPPAGPTLWNEIDATIVDYHGYKVRALIRLHGPRLELDWLEVTRLDGGEEITGYKLRSFSPQAIIRRALEANWDYPPELDGGVSLDPIEDPDIAYGLFSADEANAAKDAGPVDDTLRMVGKLYTLAYALNDAPAKAVAKTFGVSARTAGNWISKAKQAGHIATDVEEGERDG